MAAEHEGFSATPSRVLDPGTFDHVPLPATSTTGPSPYVSSEPFRPGFYVWSGLVLCLLSSFSYLLPPQYGADKVVNMMMLSIPALFLFPLWVRAAWNRLVPRLGLTRAITYWEAFAVAILAGGIGFS